MKGENKIGNGMMSNSDLYVKGENKMANGMMSNSDLYEGRE